MLVYQMVHSLFWFQVQILLVTVEVAEKNTFRRVWKIAKVRFLSAFSSRVLVCSKPICVHCHTSR